MALSNYAELQTAVTNWLHEDTLTSVIPDFITLGEATLNRRLRLQGMESSASVDTNTVTRFATLPADFSEIIDLTIFDEGYPQVINQLPLAQINGYEQSQTCRPTAFAISSNIIYSNISDQVYPATLRYYSKLDIATDSTNFLLSAYPDIYLYSALVAAAPYLHNDERINTWATLLTTAINEATRADGRNRSKVKLSIEPGLRQMPNGNILFGE